MAENYSLNSGFGFNISQRGAKTSAAHQTESAITAAANSLFSSVNNFFEKNEKVFTGEVEQEINMYSRQAMIVGMNLRASDKTIRKFDMNI